MQHTLEGTIFNLNMKEMLEFFLIKSNHAKVYHKKRNGLPNSHASRSDKSTVSKEIIKERHIDSPLIMHPTQLGESLGENLLDQGESVNGQYLPTSTNNSALMNHR